MQGVEQASPASRVGRQPHKQADPAGQQCAAHLVVACGFVGHTNDSPLLAPLKEHIQRSAIRITRLSRALVP